MDWPGLQNKQGLNQPNNANENTMMLFQYHQNRADDGKKYIHDINDGDVNYRHQTFVCKLSCV